LSDQSVNIPSESDGGLSLKEFQLTTEGIKDKSSKEYGLAICKYIASTTSFTAGGYYFDRNARFIKNRNYANGRIDIQAMFQDRFQFNGKNNYVALNWNALQIVNRIVSGLVGRWMKRNEKIQIKAIDSLSQTEKQEEFEQLEFIIENREKLEQLQQESGVPILPNDPIPEDKEALNIWRAEMQRLPEEIMNEMGCNDVLMSNGWYDVLKEKMLHDAAEVLFVGTYTYMDNEGVIHVRRVKPENAIYSFDENNDLRDTSWRGEAPSIKISELRRQYGKEFNPDNPLALTEKQLWDIAQKSKDYQYQSNLAWNDLWYTSFLRPYDEWNIRSIQIEVKTVDSEPYTVTKTKTTGSTYTQKGYPTTQSGKRRERPLDNQNIIQDTGYNIYRGVYLPDCNILLEWGLKDNMIRPQDPKEIGNCEFSYSFVMPQNYMMRNLAIPEKIEAAVDGMILACLKMQQVVARMRPTGAAIDETALQSIDYGLGDAGNKDIDYKKLYDQTGDIYYRGIDAEGNRVPVPITELRNSGFLDQMNGLIAIYQFWYQSLKDELGEDPNLISQALQPRVAGVNVEASQMQSEFATDYMYRAYAECMKITARKISCLLKDSIEYGANAYRHIAKKEDFDGRIFSTDIRFLPTDFEVQRFEAMMNQLIAATPDLMLFIDPFQMMRTAKEDVKLAELLFRHAQKRMLAWQRQTAMENQQQTIQGQIEAAKTAEEEKRKTMEEEMKIEERRTKITGQAQNQTAIVNMVAALMKPTAEGVTPTIPAEFKPIVDAVLQNIMVNAVAQTEEEKQRMIEQIQAAQMQAQMEQQAAQQGGQPMGEEVMMQEQISEQQPQMVA
jgi:hypothetical protein